MAGIDALSALGAQAASGTGASSKEPTVLSQDEFFKIMITELTNQDPLEPLDNSEFLNQVSQMQTLETMTRLSKGIQSLMLGQQVTSAGVLIGRVVTGNDANGIPTQGFVERVLFQNGNVMLGVGDRLMPVANVQEVAY